MAADRVMRVWELEDLSDIWKEFVMVFQKKQLYSGVKRFVIKEYPKEAGQAYNHAGFMKEMQNYVLYR